MKKLDKKQIPQFAALCILSAGAFGYFVLKVVTPSPAAAGTRPPAAAPSGKSSAPVTQTGAKPPATAAAAAIPDAAGAPPPSPGMRDPFVVAYVDTKTTPAVPAAPPAAPLPVQPKPAKPGRQIASLRGLPPAPVVPPAAPALPENLSHFSVRPGARTAALTPAPISPKALAAPVTAPPPAAPAWTVTGVLQGETEKVAILRSGEARRIVRTGDFVDSVYRVVEVTRSAVTLRHGATFYQLMLGASKAAPTGPVPATGTPAPGPAAPVSANGEPTEAALAMAAPSPHPLALLAHAGRSLARLAQNSLVPINAAPMPAALGHARVATTDLVAMRFLDNEMPVPDADGPRARLAAGVALYQNGRRTQGRAEWQHVLAMDDFDAADEAGKLLDRCP